jgi:Domain of unknown function (DUF4499)
MAATASNRPTNDPETFIMYERPSRAAVIGASVFSISLTLLTLSSAFHAAVCRWIPLPSRQLFQRWFVVGGLLHVAEAGYTYRLAVRSGRSQAATRWALSNFAVGFPVLLRLRTLVHADRQSSAFVGPELA